MSIEVIGISGSPIKNSNKDRLIKAILDATGDETEFVKLSQLMSSLALLAKQVFRITFVKLMMTFQF